MKNKYLSINEIQNQIIKEFKIFDNDIENTLEYLMEIGNGLPKIEEKYKTEENKIKGCLSQVWLICKNNNNRLYFEADSNTDITKGLVSLLIRIFSGQTVEEILNAELYFMRKIGLENMIGSQRTSGYINMLNQINFYAKSNSVILI